jgi:hypothetical protein
MFWYIKAIAIGFFGAVIVAKLIKNSAFFAYLLGFIFIAIAIWLSSGRGGDPPEGPGSAGSV